MYLTYMNTDYVCQTDKNKSRNIKNGLNYFSVNNTSAFHKINFLCAICILFHLLEQARRKNVFC